MVSKDNKTVSWIQDSSDIVESTDAKIPEKKPARKRKDGQKVIPLAKELFAMNTNGRGRISFL